jgi:alanine dehydrogenase
MLSGGGWRCTLLLQHKPPDAGAGTSIADRECAKAGGEIATSAEEVFARAGMIAKIKEPAGP